MISSAVIFYATWVLAIVSLIGTYLNIKKHRACFIIWGFTNALWVFYDTSIGALAQAALMFCYLVLAVHGFYEWRKGINMNYLKVYEGYKKREGAVALVEKEKITGLNALQAAQVIGVFDRHGIVYEAGEE